jgi:sugar phosphate isomerase/epimerase
MIGACVDTGHVIRSAEKPHEVIEELGDRVHSLHLKDWIHGGKEQILGKGDMDLVAVARALKALNFAGPVMLEYEESPENPVPDMKEGLANWAKAVQSA